MAIKDFFVPDLISESDNYLAPSLLKHLIARSNTAQAAMRWQNSNLVVSSIFSTKFDPFGKMHTHPISKSCLAESWSSTFVPSLPFHRGANALNSFWYILKMKGMNNDNNNNDICCIFKILKSCRMSVILISFAMFGFTWVVQTWQAPRWAQLDLQGHRGGNVRETDFSSFPAFSASIAALQVEEHRGNNILNIYGKMPFCSCLCRYAIPCNLTISKAQYICNTYTDVIFLALSLQGFLIPMVDHRQPEA